MNYKTLVSDETLQKVASELKKRNFDPIIVPDKEEALKKIQELIPLGASVMNGASRTLEEIGFIEHLKSDTHGWNNLHKAIVGESDPQKQQILRREALLSDFYLGSVHALAETGEMVIASNTGSQLPHVVYSSPNLILVIGTQKIVPTLEDGRRRLREHVVPLEDVRMKEVYGPTMGTMLNKEFIFHGESSFTGRKIHVLLVNEKLGF
ncbi:lactate utilization protein [Acetobacteraceae bacterium]|nr:lactate utilization protein [Candidatus Parcubacteria bacterium]